LNEIIATVEKAGLSEKPVMIIAYTVKGKGVSFMENVVSWHGTPPTEKEYLNALQELENSNTK
jgi:transketolase